MDSTDVAPGLPLDLVIEGARVIDPENGLDGVRHVGIRGGEIAAVSPQPLAAARRIDASGLVLAPGFIDLHSHAQSRSGALLQALDGVTTALELEQGTADVSAAIAEAQADGRPINYGFSASWLLARMHLLDGVEIQEGNRMYHANQGRTGWRQPIGPRERARIADHLSAEVDAGAIGIGVLLGYAPQTDPAEYVELARAAAALRVPTFTHTRYISAQPPHTSLDAVEEVLEAARDSGAHMHLCHLNSSSNRLVDQVADAVEASRLEGQRVTTEAYPYGAGATVAAAAFLAPENLPRMGLTPQRIMVQSTGERLPDVEALIRLRADDPAASVIHHWADPEDDADRAVLLRSLLMPDTAIASDAMPPVLADGAFLDGGWPMPAGSAAHPRTAGCYAQTFAWLVRELGALSLPEAVRRCSLLPAQLLSDAVPAMRRKGRVQPGCDADLVVFDAATFAPGADYRTLAPSRGVRHLLVGGQLVVSDGVVDAASRAGQPLRSDGRS